LITNDEQHDGDLSNREEAPDTGLLHKVGSDPRGEVGTSSPQEDTLDDHVALHDKEGTEHQERVDGRTGRPVGRIIHGHTPGQMITATESAQFLAAQPFGGTGRTDSGGNTHPVGEIGTDDHLRVLGKHITQEQHSTAQQAQTKDNIVLHQELGVTAQGGVDDVGKVGLVADVHETQQGEELVHGVVAIVDPEVLEALKKLHQEEPKDADGILGVSRFDLDVNGDDEAKRGKRKRHRLVEAHGYALRIERKPPCTLR